MAKVENIILKFTLFASVILLGCDLVGIRILEKKMESIFHNIRRDTIRENWHILLSSLPILFIILIIFSAICLMLIYRRKKRPVEHYDSLKESIEDLTPTVLRTSRGPRNKQRVVISENFKNIFMPKFYKKDLSGFCAYEVLKEELVNDTWTITDLGRIARMCFEAEIHNPQYDKFTTWMKVFCYNLNRNDCPDKPDKKSYKIAENSPLLKRFTCIVRFSNNKDSYSTNMHANNNNQRSLR